MLICATGPRDWRFFFAGDLRILFDGTEVKTVIEADDEAGYIVRYRIDEAGRPIDDGRNFLTERLEGKVEFIGTKRFSPDDAKAAAQAKRARRAARNLRNAAAQGGAA